jgi:DNA-binding transcriptional MerR regulator
METEVELRAIIEALRDMGYSREDFEEWVDENPDETVISMIPKGQRREFRQLAEYHYKRLS